MILLFYIDVVYPVCRIACLDTFGEHKIHYRELQSFKYRHDFVSSVIFDIYHTSGYL